MEQETNQPSDEAAPLQSQVTVVGSGTDKETEPVTIEFQREVESASQSEEAELHRCSLCERTFRFGDYLYLVEGQEKKILCRSCFSHGKGQKARLLLVTNGAVSTVGRDRIAKRAKKLQRLSKKQGKGR